MKKDKLQIEVDNLIKNTSLNDNELYKALQENSAVEFIKILEKNQKENS